MTTEQEASSKEASFRDAESFDADQERYPENLVQDLVVDDNNMERGTTHALRRTSSNDSTFSSRDQDIISRVLSQGAESRALSDQKTPMPKMGGGKEYPPDLPDREAWRVDFDGPDDPKLPQNWSMGKKLRSCAVLAYTSFVSTWASSIFSAGSVEIGKEFHMGSVPVSLGVALYVFGFATGPILWAPSSELYGRKPPLVLAMLGSTCFNFGVATAKDFQTLTICRFFAGFCGAAPLAIVAAAFSDLYSNKSRGTAMIIFAATVFCGPIMGPVAGGFITNSYLGWRWCNYLCGIMAGAAFAMICFLYQETYPPILLCRKAVELRRRTGNWGIYAPHEAVELDINDIVTKNLTRPIRLLFTESIIFLITIYTAFIYGILYLCLTAYPVVFGPTGYNFPGGVVEVPYISLAVGCMICMVMILTVFEPMYLKKLEQNNFKPVPEMRLLPMMTGAIAFPIGIFWFTWTGNYPEQVHWAAPTVAGIFIGYGLLSIFLPALNYIIDSYLLFAASAIAANTIMRSGFGGAFPIFAGIMFNNLGINWSGVLIGCVACALAPAPFIFFIFGKRIRSRSKFAFDLS